MGRYIAPLDEHQRTRNRQFTAIIETRLLNRTFLESVISDLGLQRAFNIRREIEKSKKNRSGLSVDKRVTRRIVALLRDKIQVQSTMPGFYKISVVDSDPETAYLLASKIADKFIEVTQEAKLQGLRQAGAFSDEQLAVYREKLEASEKKLASIRREMAATDIETNPVNASNLHVAEARKKTVEAEIEKNSLTLKRIRGRLNTIFGLVPSTEKIGNDEMLSNIERQLIAHDNETLLAIIGGEVDSELEENAMASLWDDLRGRISEIVYEEYNEFSAELRPLITEYFYQRYVYDFHSSRKQKLQSYIDRHKHNMALRPQLERDENRLNNEVETNRAIHQAFLESKTSAQITEAVQSTSLGVNISIIEKAEKTFVPIKPNKLKIILLALVFGGVCGIGTILITEYADDSFKSVEEVQRVLKAPVLGTVPKTISHFAWEKKKRGRMIVAWIIGVFLFISVVSGTLYMYARALSSANIDMSTEKDER